MNNGFASRTQNEERFLYLVEVLSWRLFSNTDTDFCVAAVEEALATYAKPDIFNTDQGSQFTSAAFTCVLQKKDIQISMDGRGPIIGVVTVLAAVTF